MIDADLETAWTVVYGFGMLALGFWFGGRTTGQLAYQPGDNDLGPMLANQHPDWVGTVQQLNKVALVVFGLAMVGLIAIDYYADSTGESND